MALVTTSPAVFRRRRAVLLAALALGVVATVRIAAAGSPGAAPKHPKAAGSLAGTHSPAPSPGASPAPGMLAPGSDPSVLPGPILIADKANNRLLEVSPEGQILWQFPQPGDLAPGQRFLIPDDAFFSPNGKEIIATEEDDSVISVIDVASRRIVYRYGTPGVPGSGPEHLSNPDDAILLADGTILTADIKNCRILLIAPGGTAPEQIVGRTTSACFHAPPARWGSPNGVFPMTNGHYLATEINGDWVDEISLSGQILRTTHPPGVLYPSDSNQVSPGVWLTVDYSSPGQIETFSPTGALQWRFKPVGAEAMDHPSLALPLPGGDILCNDDYNDRVIVVDPRTNTVVWQYGHTQIPGTQPGYLNIPDGVDLLPPNSLLGTHASTMGSASLP